MKAISGGKLEDYLFSNNVIGDSQYVQYSEEGGHA